MSRVLTLVLVDHEYNLWKKVIEMSRGYLNEFKLNRNLMIEQRRRKGNYIGEGL